MEKTIKTMEVVIDGKNFKVDYIAEDDMYIVIPEVYDEKFDKNKILKSLNLEKEYHINNSKPEKVFNSNAIIKPGYIISKPKKGNDRGSN